MQGSFADNTMSHEEEEYVLPTTRPRVVRFGDFTFDLHRLTLERDGEAIDLQRLHAQALALFVERAGTIVTREELIQSLWGDTIVDYDKSLRPMMNRLRGALGDSARRPRYLETVRGQGYRFLEEIQPCDPGETSSPSIEGTVTRLEFPRSHSSEPLNPEGSAASSRVPVATTSRRRSYLWTAVGILAAVLVVVVALFRGTEEPPSEPSRPLPDDRVPRVAVLPFESLSTLSDAEQGLVDGLSVDLAAALTRRGGENVDVILPQFVTGEIESPGDLGKRFQADYLLHGSLDGSVQSAELSLSLLEVDTGRILWSRQGPNRPLDQLDQWSNGLREVLETLQIEPGGGLRQPSPESPRDIVLRALYHNHRSSWADFDAIEKLCRDGLEQFPSDPTLLGLLATTDMRRWVWTLDQSHVASARRHAELALDHDPSEPRALLTLAKIALYLDRDPRAHSLLEDARKADPRNPQLHLEWMNYQQARGERAEAVRAARHASLVNPLDGVIQSEVDWVLYSAGHYEEVVERSAHSIELIPGFVAPRLVRLLALTTLNRHLEAAATLDGLLEIADTPTEIRDRVRLAAEGGDYRPFWTEWLALLHKSYEQSTVYPEEFVIAYVALGDHEMALHWLDQAWSAKTAWLGPLLTYPILDPLRDDPRFHEIERRVATMYARTET